MRSHVATVVGVLGVLALACGGCLDYFSSDPIDTTEEVRADRLTVAGRFCTEATDTVRFPVKVLFIMDASQAITATDPPPSADEPPGRIRALQEVIDENRDSPDVSLAFIRMATGAVVTTQRDTNGDGFPDLAGFMQAADIGQTPLDALGAAGGNTDYQAALALAEEVLTSDMRTLRRPERARTRYMVVFFTDSLPYPQDYEEEYNTEYSVLRTIEEIKHQVSRYEVGTLSFHTAYLAAEDPDYVRSQTEELLRDMAAVGQGDYRMFEEGGDISFLDMFIAPSSADTVSVIREDGLFVSNQNALPSTDPAVNPDRDGDGLSDDEESRVGTSPLEVDTDGDGFDDLTEVRYIHGGLDPLRPEEGLCELVMDRRDQDGDGLLDCVEYFIFTDPLRIDTDADGLPDPMEIRWGTSPRAQDAESDIDFDGMTAAEEVARHADPFDQESEESAGLAYSYGLDELPGPEGERVCYEFEVANIGLAEGENEIRVVVGQVPRADPDATVVFRFARASVNHVRGDADPVIQLDQEDFKLPAPAPCGTLDDCPRGQICEPSVGYCVGPACTADTGCDGNLGFSCEPVIGELCERDADCPVSFCTQEEGRCALSWNTCDSGVDCAPNACAPDSGQCTLSGAPCTENVDCRVNRCDPMLVCANEPSIACRHALDCPQTHVPGVCSREEGLGVCDQPGSGPCCFDAECASGLCLGRCAPIAGDPRRRCIDWFEP